MSDADPIINAATFAPVPQFDPRRVAVVKVDDDLPAVDASRLNAGALRARFASPPEWEPEVRLEPRVGGRSLAAAAVLIPIVQRAEPMLLLTERTTNLSNHSGQVAFPGGRVDPGDADIAFTAMREAQEEVGLSARYIEVLGHLPTYTTVTSFVVTPVVALVRPGFELTLNPHEVAHAFEVPLRFLMDPAHHRRHRVEADEPEGRGQRREWFSMPFHDGQREHFIWGATAGMLRNLYRFLIA
ncbi:MAG: CoA pyrophosphatase [Comamonadaceae bacterium]|nr:MAG: CoA pyrophosphatase [Comamonadaceae bacterium]